MSKTNFTKVEEALNEGIRKMTVAGLLKLADVSAGMGQRARHLEAFSLSDNSEAAPLVSEEHLQMIATLERDLQLLYKKDNKVYTKLNIKAKDVKRLIANQAKLTEEEWKILEEIKAKVETYKKDFLKTLPVVPDETLVEKERVKHINKRFNINEKWLPLQ